MDNPIFNLISELEKAQLWEGELEFKKGEYLKVQGNIENRFFYVLDGCFRIFIDLEDEEHTIRFAYRGNVFNALDSYVTGKPTAFYIQALRKTRVAFVSISFYERWLHSNPKYFEMWTGILKTLIIQQFEREQDLLIHSPRTRYERVLKRSPQLFQEVPLKYIANYLRMSPETLSRIQNS